MEEDAHGCFFRDKKRRADYALVIRGKSTPLVNFISSLEKFGLELEANKRPELGKLFLIIHIPPKQLEDYSKIFDIGLEVPTVHKIKRPRCMKWLYTNVEIRPKKKGTFTSTDRILIINQLLECASFGTEPEEIGLSKLLKQRVIEDAYPLHDGSPYTSSDGQTQNDRQLLFLHWARFRCWYKEVPLDLIYRYFGCEMAFYFAWVEFFNLMLLPAAILGLLVFIISLIIFYIDDIPEINEICHENNMYICPTCPFARYCVYRKLSHFCFTAKGNFIFDNYLTVGFACFMSFWALLFLKLWYRKQNTLRVKWGVDYVVSEEIEIRHQYRDELRRRNLKPKPNEIEPFLPTYVTLPRMIATISVCALLLKEESARTLRKAALIFIRPYLCEVVGMVGAKTSRPVSVWDCSTKRDQGGIEMILHDET